MKELIRILKVAAKKHGAETPLTIGHLLNICKIAESAKSHEEEAAAIREQQQHNQILEEINPLGQD